MPTFYRAEITVTLEGGRPVHTISIVADSNGYLVKRVDVEGAQPTTNGDVQAQLDRLAVLEKEHAVLLAAVTK